MAMRIEIRVYHITALLVLSATSTALAEPSTRPAAAQPNTAARAVEGVVASAREDYTHSRFDRCVAKLEPVARALPSQPVASEQPLAQRVHLWLGLCAAVGGQRALAEGHFQRAARLAGPGPDPKIFPPRVLALYQGVAGSQAASQPAPRSQPLVAQASQPSAPPTLSTRPWYRRWWVWALVGVTVAAAVTVPIALTREERYDIKF